MRDRRRGYMVSPFAGTIGHARNIYLYITSNEPDWNNVWHRELGGAYQATPPSWLIDKCISLPKHTVINGEEVGKAHGNGWI